MLIVFPVFCILAQLKNRRTVCIVAAYISLFYYLSKYDFGSHIYPNQIIRAFSAMMLGYLVYHMTVALNQRQVTKRERFLLSILEIVTMVVPLGLSAWNIVLLRIYLICFILYLTITLSNKSWLSQFDNPFILFLGKLSMPVYVWHYVVGFMLEAYMPAEISINFKIWSYYGLTLLIATINLLIAEKLWLGRRKMKSDIMVSFIIPAYNAEKTIESCIESIISYKGEELEVLIIENGSSDMTTEISQKLENRDARIKLYHSEKGVSNARNLGIQKATGKWIVFVDADDRVRTDQFGKSF